MNGLSYLPIEPPAPGTLAQVADGVHWIRMPLPMELDHINLWLIEHEDGFVLVDTGLAYDESREAWQKLESSVLRQRPLKLIVLTHYHPDHAGLVSWLQARHGVPVWMSRACEDSMRSLLGTLSSDDLAARTQFLTSHGVKDPVSWQHNVSGSRYRSVVDGLPPVAHHPADGHETTWGSTSWRWLETDGHATGHLCLHAANNRVLISGDQILPTISPNVSLTGWGTDSNPLASYLGSLDRLMQLDEHTVVLPSHGRPFIGLQQRAADLRNHHQRNLSRLTQACEQPLTAFELLRVMYGRVLKGFHLVLALGEAIAHLEYLVSREELSRCVDPEGVVRFVRP